MLTSLLVGLVSASTWQPLPAFTHSNLSSLQSFGDTLLACGTGGCASSSDQGSNWTLLRAPDAISLAPVFSGHDGISQDGHAIHLSRDGGQTWRSWTEGIGSGKMISKVDIQGEFAYAAAYDFDFSKNTLPTQDACTWYARRLDAPTWTQLDRRALSRFTCAEFHVGAGGRLFRTVDTLLPGERYTDELPQTSSDGGRTWESRDTNGVVSRVTGSRAILKRGHRYSTGMFFSFDTGRTWGAPFPTSSDPVVLDNALRASPSDPWLSLADQHPRRIATDSLGTIRDWARVGTRLWGLGSRGLFFSDDSGTSWHHPASPLPLGIGMKLRWHANALFGIFGNKVFRSIDEGRSWIQFLDIGDVYEFIPCGSDLLLSASVRRGGITRYDSIRVFPDGSWDTTSTTSTPSCPDASRWEGIALVYGKEAASANARRVVILPLYYKYGITSKAMVDGGIFLLLTKGGESAYAIDLAFVADGSDSAIVLSTLPGTRGSLVEVPGGALLATERGLFRCTATKGCVPDYLPGTDSLWAMSGIFQPSTGALVGVSHRRDSSGLPDFSRIMLHASRDSGRTWTAIDAPGLISSVALTPTGIVASISYAGLWRLDSDIFRVTGVSNPPSQRSTKPSFEVRGRILSISGASAGAHLRIVDATGRIVLDARPESRDGAVSVALPATAKGILFADLENSGTRASFRWVNSGR